MPFSPAGAAQRIHALADAVAASPADVTTVHDTLVASGLEAPAGLSPAETAAGYAQLIQRLPQVISDHPEVVAALNALRSKAGDSLRDGIAEPGEINWDNADLLEFLCICVLMCP